MKTDIAKKLRKKKYVKPNRFVYFIYRTIVAFITPRYHIHYNIIDDVKKEKGPVFIIFNHKSRMDHYYLLNSTYPKLCVNVAGYNEFFRKKFKFVFNIANIIPKKNYTPDFLTIKGITNCIKSGGSIVFSPEGLACNFGVNKPIVPDTSKLFKHFNIPVYLCKLEGEYLQCPKFNTEERLGKSYCTMTRLFTPEDTQRLSVEEMDDIVNEKLWCNEFEWNRKMRIKYNTHGHSCEGLENLLYRCPKCGQEFKMVSKGDHLYCSHCGNGTTMDGYYDFHPYEGSTIPLDISEWMKLELKSIIDEIREDPNYSFEDEVEIGNLDNYKYIKSSMDTTFKVGNGRLYVDHKGVHFEGTRNNKPYRFDLSYNEIYTTITFNDASYFSFYVNGECFDFFPKHKTTGKFIILIEEMHRYHVNYYKNFKWYDDLYEGKELGIDNKK